MKVQFNPSFALPADLGANRNPVGEICLANEARFESTFYSEPLTAYTVGWKDPENLDQLIEDLFPSVMVGRRFEFKKGTNAEFFLSEADDVRAIGAPFKRVEFTGSTVNERTLNKGLTIRVDHDEQIGDGWEQIYVGRLMARLLRNDLRRSLAILDNAATSLTKQWASTTTPPGNPDGDIRASLKLAQDASGIRPNVIAIGQAAMDLRLDCYETINTPYAGRAAAMTMQELADKLMVDKVIPVKARYQSTATAKEVLVPSALYAYLAIPGVSKDEPSNVKRFISPARAGGRFGVYVQVHEKFTDISVEQYSNTVVTSTLGIRKIAAQVGTVS